MIWKQLQLATGLSSPRLARGLRELEKLGVVRRVWLDDLRWYLYELTGKPVPPLVAYSHKRKETEEFEDMKHPSAMAHVGNFRPKMVKPSRN